VCGERRAGELEEWVYIRPVLPRRARPKRHGQTKRNGQTKRKEGHQLFNVRTLESGRAGKGITGSSRNFVWRGEGRCVRDEEGVGGGVIYIWRGGRGERKDMYSANG
jgi:hypothetical protein